MRTSITVQSEGRARAPTAKTNHTIYALDSYAAQLWKLENESDTIYHKFNPSHPFLYRFHDNIPSHLSDDASNPYFKEIENLTALISRDDPFPITPLSCLVSVP